LWHIRHRNASFAHFYAHLIAARLARGGAHKKREPGAIGRDRHRSAPPCSIRPISANAAGRNLTGSCAAICAAT
jgi:hypothetical protein